MKNATLETMKTATNVNEILAIQGGAPFRSKPMPIRMALSAAEEASMLQVLAWYRARGEDPCYQGHFEELYCQAFADFQGGGYADAVATGTVSLYVALAALNLPKGSEVLVSPITDPGTLSAIILLGLKPKLVDSMVDSFNTGPEQVEARLGKNTSCALIVHAAGRSVEIDTITSMCHTQGVRVLEDCSQAHGALWKGVKIGNFGDIAAFSTMYRKASTTGPTGGVVFSRHQDIYHQALAHADRGKPRWEKGFDDRNPNHFLFPALNLHSNEFSCAIGLASLGRLPETIKRRLKYVEAVSKLLTKYSVVCRPSEYSQDDSPFYYPIFVNTDKITCSKIEFAKAVLAEGIGLNPHYQYVVQEWEWMHPYLADNFDCINARTARDSAFCLYLNENYTEQEAEDTVAAILKVERHYRNA